MCLEFITDNLHREVRLKDVARTAGLSQFHFARLFREATRQTPHQYQLERIARAKYLLRTTSSRIDEIRIAVGFLSAASFSRSFTSREGMSPQSWRRRI
jgi:AraC family transcriptional regulator